MMSLVLTIITERKTNFDCLEWKLKEENWALSLISPNKSKLKKLKCSYIQTAIYRVTELTQWENLQIFIANGNSIYHNSFSIHWVCLDFKRASKIYASPEQNTCNSLLFHRPVNSDEVGMAHIIQHSAAPCFSTGIFGLIRVCLCIPKSAVCVKGSLTYRDTMVGSVETVHGLFRDFFIRALPLGTPRNMRDTTGNVATCTCWILSNLLKSVHIISPPIGKAYWVKPPLTII